LQNFLGLEPANQQIAENCNYLYPTAEQGIAIMIMYIRVNSACLLPFWPPQILGICMVQQTLAKLGKVCNIFAQLFGFREC